MKFLLYKLYQIALSQEASVGSNFAFLLIIFLFEIWHFLVIGLILKILNFEIALNGEVEKYFGILSLVLLSIFNYYFFIKSKKIFSINDYFKNSNLKGWKGNLIFTLYIFLLITIMYFEVFLYQKYR